MSSEPSASGGVVPADTDHVLVTVQLLNFPLQLFAYARQHHDEVMREFAILALSPPQDRPGHAVPVKLLSLVDALGVRFAGTVDRTDAVRDAAAARGDIVMDLAYDVPVTVAPAMQELDRLLDEADELSRDGALLTVAASPLQQEFWAWFMGEFISQTAGGLPTPWSGPLAPPRRP